MYRASRCDSSQPRRRGAVLMEVLVAITVLVIAGVGMVSLLSQTTESVHLLRQRERDTRLASAELDRAALWTRDQLNARIGTSRLVCCTLVVQPIAATLFRVALADTATGAILLETSIYQPIAAHATTP